MSRSVLAGDESSTRTPYARDLREAPLVDDHERLETYEAVLRSVKDGVIVIDSGGKIVHMNPAALELHELTDDVYQSHFGDPGGRFEVYRPDGSPMPVQEWPGSRVLAGESFPSCELVVHNTRTGRRWIGHYAGAPVRNAAGEIVMGVLTIRDVTSQREVERQVLRGKELSDCLVEIDRHLSVVKGLEDVVGVVLERARVALGASGAAIARREEGGWVTGQLAGLDPHAVGQYHPDDECPTLMKIYQTRKPVIVRDVRHSRCANRRQAERIGYRSYVSFPLKLRDTVAGVVSFFFEKPRGPFSAQELDFVANLAMTLSLAEENTRLYSRERRIAEAFQRALLVLPRDFTNVDVGYVYQPAAEEASVGGDFYDVFSLPDERIAMSIGDVSGSGLRAAVLSALVRDAIRTSALDDPVPSRVLRKVNRVLRTFSKTEEFATVFFGVLDPENGELEYADGGHPAPLIVDGDGGTRCLVERGPLVGVFKNLRFVGEMDVVPAGGRIVLFTDGISDARARDGDFFRVDGVREVVSGAADLDARGCARALFEQAAGFADGSLRDDAAILVIGRRNRQ